jgi:hypothetical protein
MHGLWGLPEVITASKWSGAWAAGSRAEESDANAKRIDSSSTALPHDY